MFGASRLVPAEGNSLPNRSTGDLYNGCFRAVNICGAQEVRTQAFIKG